MPSDPKMRASDQDRERTAALLREHHAAGRLTLDEFNERLDKTYAAKTMGELEALMADLPAIDLYQLPDASLRHGQSGYARLPWLHPPGTLMLSHGRFSPAWRAAWSSWISITTICFIIWLLSGSSLSNPWFLWIVGPWGLLMLGRWITGAPGQHGHGDSSRPGSDRHGHGDSSRPGSDRHGHGDSSRPGSDGHGRDRHRDRRRDRDTPSS